MEEHSDLILNGHWFIIIVISLIAVLACSIPCLIVSRIYDEVYMLCHIPRMQ